MQKFSPLIPLLLITCFTGLADLGAQRSLYQDALALAKFNEFPASNISFFLTPADTANVPVISINNIYGNNDNISTDTLTVPYHEYNLSFGPTFSERDTLTIRYGMSEAKIGLGVMDVKNAGIPDSLIDERRGGLVIRAKSNYSQATSLGDRVTLAYDVFYPCSDSMGPECPYDEGYLSLIPQSRRELVEAILKRHIYASKKTSYLEEQAIDLEEGYATNPFIQVEDIFSPYANFREFNLNEYIRAPTIYWETADTEVLNYKNTISPFQKVLNGDSVLTSTDFVVPVDETASYRQRIVTAQTRLESANIALEKQRKKGGLLDVNTVAVGLSDFIAERAQEELNLTFFNRFKENLAKDSELSVLFPTTRDLLNKFEISNYKVFLAHARETFNTDLDQLGVNLSGVLKLPKYKRFRDDPNVFNLALIYDIANAAYQEKTVEEIILSTHQQLVERQKNLTESINLEIADTLLVLDKTATGAPLPFAFRDSLQRYMQDIRKVANRIKGTIASFAEPTGYSLFEDFNDPFMSPENIQIEQYNLAKLEESSPENAAQTGRFLSIVSDLFEAGEYDTFYSSGEGKTSVSHHGKTLIASSYLEHSMKVIPALLEGHDYFGYYFTDDDYERLYLERLRTIENEDPVDYLAGGLDKARVFLDVPFDERTLDFYNKVAEARLKVENELKAQMDDINEQFFNEVLDLIEQAKQNLHWKMEKDLAFLLTQTGKEILQDRFLVELELFRQDIQGQRKQQQYKDVKDYVYNIDNGFRSFVTKASMVSGANKYLDIIENEWEELFQRALTHHKIPISKVTRAKTDYEAIRQHINTLRTYTTQQFEKTDRRLDSVRLEVEQLGNLRKYLSKEFDAMELAFAPKLVKARQNASELAKAMELSAHILFSFRDYSQKYDTLYYRDTQRVEITVQQTNPNNGMVNTFKKDSILVELTPVPGTTEPLRVAKWITRREFDDLRRDPKAWNFFLGLLYSRLNSVQEGRNFSPRSVATLSTQFLKIANEIQDNQDKLRRKKGNDPRSVSLKDYFPYIRSTVDLFNVVLTTPLNGDTSSISKRAAALGKITEISNEALSLYENIDVREYGNAILNATELLRIITNREYTEAELDAMGKEERKRRTKTQRQVAAIFKYGTFMAEMINAKSSEQVKTILKSTTLPPGSSRIKREVQSSITINSYLGAGLGRDRLLDVPMDIDADAFGAALSVPIGLTYSFSPKFLNNRSSFSIHVPLLDLGAITAYRSNPNGQTTNVDALPELEWKNLFSPGAYLIYNFADSPFSLGIGGQYGPQLRELNQANGEPIFLNSFRFPMISATIDVPFYNLHTGPRKMVVK